MTKRITALLMMVLCVAMLAVPAAAYERVDTGAKASLTLTYKDGEKVIAGMEMRVYKVLEMSDAVVFTPTEEFKEYAGMMDLVNQAKWADLADDLVTHLSQNDTLQPTATAVTDETGTAVFADLSVGVYLVTGAPKSEGRYTYTPKSFITTLPVLDKESDVWYYAVNASGKGSGETEPYNPKPTTVSRNAMKKWDDEGADVERPESVTVQLLQDGKVYDTKVLSAANNWRCSWTGLDKSSAWSLIEVDVPEGYTCEVSQTGNTFVVTNSADPVEELPDDPVPGGPGGGDELEDPEVPLGGLPQTGTLWWMVPVLAVMGCALCAAGIVVLRGGKKEGND